MTSISKNVSINTLADIVNDYNNTYHSKVKMKPKHWFVRPFKNIEI